MVTFVIYTWITSAYIMYSYLELILYMCVHIIHEFLADKAYGSRENSLINEESI